MRVHVKGGTTGHDTKVFVVDEDGNQTMLRGVQSVHLNLAADKRNTACILMAGVTVDVEADAQVVAE